MTVNRLCETTGSGVFFGHTACHVETRATEKDPLPLRAATAMRYWWIVVALIGLCHDVRAQDPPAAAQTDLRYKREFIPADSLEEVAKMRGYMTMERAKFERIMQRLEAQPDDRLGAGITRAVYRAKLNRHQLVDGSAEWDVAHTSPSPVNLQLASLGFAVGQPLWQEGDPRDATIALAADGSLVLKVDRAGTLSFPWSLSGTAAREGVVTFDVRLPPCPDNELIVDLPNDMIPQATKGIVQPLADPPTEGRRSWSILLGGQLQTTLRIVPQRVLARQQRLVLLRESLFYDFAPGVVRLTAELRLDILYQPLNKLTIQLDPGTQFVSATVGNRELESTRQKDGAHDRYELTFPELLMGVDRIVRVTALTKFDTGSNWTLPRIRAADTLWQQGRSELFVPEVMSLEQMTTENGAQAGFRVLTNPKPGESFIVRFFNESAATTVRIANQPPKIVASTGTTIRLNEVEMTASFIADLESRQGACFLLSSALPQDWTVDNVAASILASTSEDAGSNVPLSWAAISQSSQTVLQVRLERAIRADRKIRLSVNLKRTRPPEGSQLTIADFRLLKLDQADAQRQLISVIPEPPLRLDWSGTVDLDRPPAGDPTNRDSELVATGSDGLSFADGEGARYLTAVLRLEPEQFIGKIVVRAAVRGNQLVESYQVRCEPRSSLVPGVRIHLSQSRGEAIQWTLEGADRRDFSTRRLSREEELRKNILPEGGETWEVALRRHRNVPFVIRGERVSTLEKGQTLALVWLPDAVEQTASLMIHSSDGTSISVSHPGLEPFPVAASDGKQYSTLRAALRYSPESHPRVQVTGNRRAAHSLAWAWNCSVDSRYARDGGVHQITYWLENAGSRHIELTLPSGLALRQLLVNGRLVENLADSSMLVVQLPADNRFPQVQITVTDTKSLPGVWGQLAAQLPAIDVPVFETQWTVWLPDGYEPFSSNLMADQSSPFERLLGPLYSRTGRPVRADSVEQWRNAGNLFASESPAESLAFQLLQTLLDSIEKLKQQATVDGVTWRQVLTHHGDATSNEHLQIDSAALAQLGITPDTIVGELLPGDPPTELLTRSNLVLIADDDRLLLTSSAVRALLAKQLRPTSRNEIVRVSPDGATGNSVIAGVFDRSCSAREWCDESTAAQVAWPRAVAPEFAAVANAGLTAFQVDLSGGGMQLAVYRMPVLQAFAWGVFFVVAAGAWWVACKRPCSLIVVAAFAGTVALVVPTWCVPIANSALLGVLLAAVLVLVWKRVPHSRATRPVPTAVETTAAGMALLLAVGLCCPRLSWADDEVAASPTYYPVLIGMDPQQQPVGDLVYLPRDFHAEILRRDALLGAVPTHWMATAAEYECTLHEEVGGTTAATELTALFTIDVMQAGRVSLPLNRKNLLLQRGELDAQPVQLDWNKNETSVEFDVPEPGRRQLKIVFRPVATANGDRLKFAASIPRIPSSRLRVRGAQAAKATTPTALGAGRYDADAETLSVALGPTDQLVLEWPEVNGVEAQENTVAVSQLLWLRVEPGTVVIDGQFTFQLPPGRDLRQVDLLVDPRLQMRIPADQPVRIKQQRADAAVNNVTLEFDRRIANTVSVRATFSLYDNSAVVTSGIGTLRLPRVEAIAESTPRRWLAVSVDPALLLEHVPDTSLEPLEVAEFIGQWGDISVPQHRPQLALRMPDGDVPWTFATRKVVAELTVVEQTEIRVGINQLDVQYEAGLQIAGQVYQLHIDVPPNLDVQHVALSENVVDRVRRWSRIDATTVHVTLDGPVSENQQLLIAGRHPVPSNHQVRLPRISLAGARSLASRFTLFRQPDVRQIAIEQPIGLRELDEAERGELQSGQTQPVAVWESTELQSETPPTAALRLTENNSPAKCVALINVVREDGAWYADFVCEFTRVNGVIDEVRIDVPANWDELVVAKVAKTFEQPRMTELLARSATHEDAADLNGGVQLQPVEVPGKSRRILVIQPGERTGDALRLRIRGRLKGQPISAPDIWPLSFQYLQLAEDDVELHVALPTELDGQEIEWDTLGLESAPLPERLASAIGLTSTRVVHRVAARPYQAKVHEVRTSPRAPHVRLADVHVAWNADGSCFGRALFDLEPNGNETCALRLPPDYDLVQATVDGRPALLSAAQAGMWQVALGPHRLPQQIAVVFQGQDAVQEDRRIFAAPSISDATTTQTLWTIHHPGRMRHALADIIAASVGQGDLHVRRLRTIAAMLNAASKSPREDSQPEINTWFSGWWQRFAHTQQQLQRHGAGLLEPQVGKATTELSQAAETLKTVDQMGPLSDFVNVVDAWTTESPTERSATYHTVGGSAATLEMTFGTSAWQGIILRLGHAIAYLCALAILVLSVSRGPLMEWMLRWPYAWGVLWGVAWWLWLTPSAFGWVIIAICVLSSFRAHGVSVREQAVT